MKNEYKNEFIKLIIEQKKADHSYESFKGLLEDKIKDYINSKYRDSKIMRNNLEYKTEKTRVYLYRSYHDFNIGKFEIILDLLRHGKLTKNQEEKIQAYRFRNLSKVGNLHERICFSIDFEEALNLDFTLPL